MMNDSNSGWQAPYLINNIQRLTDSYLLRVLLASFFSGGKIIQSAGLNVIGVNSLLVRFTHFNATASIPIMLFFMMIDVLATGATRAPKIYHYFLPQKKALTALYASALDFSETDDLADSADIDLRGCFVFSLRDQKLYRIDRNNRSQRATSLSRHDQQLLEELHLAISNHLVGNQEEDILSAGNAHSLLVDALSVELLALFIAKRNAAASLPYGVIARSVYYVFYTLCCLSVPFSLLNGYVSGYSLTDTADSTLVESVKITLGVLVAISAIVSYLNFNLAKMHEGVKAFCQSLDDGLVKGNFGIPKKAMLITLMSTVLGILSGIGWSYLITAKSLDSFPPAHYLTPAWKTVFIVSNAFISIFPSVFASAFSSYELIKQYFPENPVEAIPVASRYPHYAILIMLIDSFSSTVGGFTGSLMIIDAYTDVQTQQNVINGLIALAALSFLNSIIMYASLGLVGSKQAIAYIGQLTCCQPAERDLLTIKPESSRTSFENADLETLDYRPVLPGASALTIMMRTMTSQNTDEFQGDNFFVALENTSADTELRRSSIQ